jgi:large subunit ribosomal protein L17
VALLRNLSTALFEKEKITTTLAKAKELRPFAEKLLTMAKKETLHARRMVLRHVQNKKVAAKLLDTLSARYAQRPGGYTRILKLGPRRGDHAEMALIELVGAEGEDGSGKKAKAAKKGQPKAKASKKARPKKAAAKGAVKDQPATATAKKKATKSSKKKSSSKKKRGDAAAAEDAAKPVSRKKAKTKAKTKAKAKAKAKSGSKTAKTKKN